MLTGCEKPVKKMQPEQCIGKKRKETNLAQEPLDVPPSVDKSGGRELNAGYHLIIVIDIQWHQ